MSQYKITNLTNGTLSFAAGSVLGPGGSRNVSKVSVELKRLEQRGFLLIVPIADDPAQLPSVEADTEANVKSVASATFGKSDLVALLAGDNDVKAAVAALPAVAGKASAADIAAAVSDRPTATAVQEAIASAVANRPTSSTVTAAISAATTDRLLTGSKTFDWPSLVAGGFQTTTVSVPGATLGDCARASLQTPLLGTILFAEVTANNNVTVRQWNPTGAAVDLASATLNVWVDHKL